MANDITTNPRLWILDTVGQLKAPSYKVFIRMIHFEPTNINQVVEISEYAPNGTTTQLVLRVTSGPAVALPVDIVYDRPFECNGAYLTTLTAGKVYLQVDNVVAPLAA